MTATWREFVVIVASIDVGIMMTNNVSQMKRKVSHCFAEKSDFVVVIVTTLCFSERTSFSLGTTSNSSLVKVAASGESRVLPQDRYCPSLLYLLSLTSSTIKYKELFLGVSFVLKGL